jgi:restriction system protein
MPRQSRRILITTGSFTKEAIKEATRDGVPLINLVDGNLLCDKMKELKLGIDVEETVDIKKDWFDSL